MVKTQSDPNRSYFPKRSYGTKSGKSTKRPQRLVQNRYFSFSEMHDTSFFFFLFLFFLFFYIIYLLLFYIIFINYFFVKLFTFFVFFDVPRYSGMFWDAHGVPSFIDGLTTVVKSLKKWTYCCFKICRSYSSTSFNLSNVGDFLESNFLGL